MLWKFWWFRNLKYWKNVRTKQVELIKSKIIRNDVAKSLGGKLNHYSALVQGEYWRCLIIYLGQEDQADDYKIAINGALLVAPETEGHAEDRGKEDSWPQWDAALCSLDTEYRCIH